MSWSARAPQASLLDMNTDASTGFSAVTYNILAQAYIKPERYVGIDPRDLDPVARRGRIVARVVALDADLYCLQEVDASAYADLAAALGADFHGLYEGKRGREDGLAIFFRRSLFTLDHQRAHHYAAVEPGYDHLALFAFLRAGERPLAVTNTHLRWQGREVRDDEHQGLQQFRELLSVLREEAWPNGLIAGDLNAAHGSPVLAEAKRAGLSMSAASLRPWDTALINGRRRKIDYIYVDRERLSPSPRPLPGLSKHRPIPSTNEGSDHLPLQIDYTWS